MSPTPSSGSERESGLPEIRTSPFCIHLRTKKAYFLREPALEDGDLLDGSGHCWCQKTMLALGPDGEAALPSACRAGRTCFAAIL